MNHADRTTLRELTDFLEEMNECPDGPIPQFLATLSRVLEEPGDETLILWAMCNTSSSRAPFIIQDFSEEEETQDEEVHVLYVPEEPGVSVAFAELGTTDSPPVLSPEAREILVREWRRANAKAAAGPGAD